MISSQLGTEARPRFFFTGRRLGPAASSSSAGAPAESSVVGSPAAASG